MAPPAVNPYDVVVIGAGCAGLSAAVRASAGGLRVLVLEARSRLGGRATAFTDRETGELVDNGQHVLLGCYTETLAFLQVIGASSHVRHQAQLAVTIVDRDGRVTRLRCPSLPAPLHLVAGVARWPALGWRDRWSVLRMAGPLRAARRMVDRASRRAPGGGGPATTSGPVPSTAAAPAAGTAEEGSAFERSLRALTVDGWLRACGQTPRLRELLWEPLALAALNQDPSIASAEPFARVLAEMFGTDAAAATIVLPARPLHEMYAEPARRFIEARGGTVRTGMTARVTIADGAARVTSGDEHWTPSCVIAAVPWFAVPALFDGDVSPLDGVIDAARGTAPSPIVTVNLWYDRAVMDEAFVGLPGRLMQWVFDKRAVLGAGASHLSLVSSGAADVLRWTNPDLIARATSEVAEALPRAADARVVRATVIREPNATFSLAPGQPRRPGTRTPVRGLFLAGDWIGTALPATIEAAVRSGHLAAEAALASCTR